MDNYKSVIKIYQEKEKRKVEKEIERKEEQDKLNLYLITLREKIKKVKDLSFLINIVIETDKIISVNTFKKDGHRTLKIKCLDCGSVRDVKVTKFLAKRPLKEGKCECKRYLPKNNMLYSDTIRGTHVYIGRDTVKNNKQYIWIKCIVCKKITCVIGEDYLKGKYINSCKHDIQEIKKDNDLLYPDFKKSSILYPLNYFKVGDIVEHYEIIDFIGDSLKAVILRCLKCNDIIKVSLRELYRLKHTQTLYHCFCYGDDIKINTVYGNLRVLYKTEKNKYVCKCLCGNKKEIIREKYQLNSGVSLSCGCESRDLKSIYNRVNYIGKIYNNLKVLEIGKSDFSSKQGIVWRCQCLLCNNVVDLNADQVVNNIFTNCGCKNKRYVDEYSVGDNINNFIIQEIIKEKGTGTFWAVKCPFCGDSFVRLASNIEKGHYKSCGCLQKSLGEIYIEEILNKYNLDFQQQISFKDLKKGALRFDFLVIFNNQYYLIEYDGLQHYYSSSYFSKDKKGFKQLQYNDQLKNEYAKNKGIPLLRIKYTLNKEKIEEEIKNFIGGF